MVNRLLLVRHGENRANLTKEFSCRKVDYSLTPKGLLQARQTAEFLSRENVDEVWSSPLKRAAETAAETARFLKAGVEVLEGLREMDVGDLEGLWPVEAAWAIYTDTMREWLGGNPDHRFPNGESRRELCRRFRESLEHITRGKSCRTILVVGHGGIFTHGVAVLCAIKDERTFIGLENHNCSIGIVDVVREGESLRFDLIDWASIGHLSGEAARVIEGVPESARVKNL